MSIQLKKKSIKLPFTVSSTSYGAAQPKTVCGICHKNQSKYICPRCNVVYCSIDCFRAENHAQCSEPFYQSSVREAIAADPTASKEEKQKMMEMLQRFEAGQLELDEELGVRPVGGDEVEDDDEDEEDESDEVKALKASLADVNLDDIDSNKLFSLLPPSHRAHFISLLQAPESDEARKLVEKAAADEGIPARAPQLPWFDVVSVVEHEDSPHAEDPAANQTLHRLESQEIGFLYDIAVPDETAVKLIYNILAIGIAYIHVLRLHDIRSLSDQPGSPVASEAKDDIAQILPFLVAPKSTDRFESVRQAWEYVWPSCVGLNPDEMTPSTSGDLLDVLRTVRRLSAPSVDLSSRHRLLLLLCDMYTVWSRPKVRSTGKKLAFYAKAVQAISRSRWLQLQAEVEKEIEKLEEELVTVDDDIDAGQSRFKIIDEEG